MYAPQPQQPSFFFIFDAFTFLFTYATAELIHDSGMLRDEMAKVGTSRKSSRMEPKKAYAKRTEGRRRQSLPKKHPASSAVCSKKYKYECKSSKQVERSGSAGLLFCKRANQQSSNRAVKQLFLACFFRNPAKSISGKLLRDRTAVVAYCVYGLIPIEFLTSAV